MTKLTFVAHDGTRFDVEAENGSTVMENAIRRQEIRLSGRGINPIFKLLHMRPNACFL